MTGPDHKGPHRSSHRLTARLTVHASHTVLRKVSTVLRVRIDPGLVVHGPCVVIDDVTPAELMIVAQILEDWGT